MASVWGVDAPSLTRRRALALGAAAGLSSVVGATPAWARGGGLTRSFSLAVGRSAFAGRGLVTEVLRAPARFDLLGVAGAARGGLGLEVRVRPLRGAWSPWVPLGSGHDHRPDAGTGAHASDPVWAGGADELQLRAARRPAGALSVRFVAVSPRVRRMARSVRAHASQLGAAPTIIPRSAWGGDGVRPRAAPDYGDVQVAFVHHTVSANDYAPEDSAGIVLSMAKYHRDVNGWNDLGYNFVVDRYGQIFEGRAGGVDQAVIGAQAQGYNSHSTGIANIGTFTAVGQTDAALDAISRLIAWKLPLHGSPVVGEVTLVSAGGEDNRYRSGTPVVFQRISGHRDGDATECPGDALYAQLPELRRRTAAIAPAVTAPVAGPAALAMAPPAKAAVYGSKVTIAGTLRNADGSGVAGQRVLIQKQGSTGWVTVARTTSGSDGTWSTAVAWRATGKLRARAALPGSASPLVSSPASITCTPLLVAKAKTTRVKAGKSVPVSGTVRPLAPVVVTIEKQAANGTYKKVGTTTIKPRRAAFSSSIRLTEPGLYRLTPHTGTGPTKASAAALYVRAVRKQSSVPPTTGGTAA
jgi:N-acetylmuramoyl-L-alanine amidase